MGGHFWAQLGKWAARHMRVRPPSRTAPTLLLLLLLLAPYGSTLFLLLGSDSASCGMACCKRSKACCYRKERHSANQEGPAWAPASKCPDGCRQLPATQESPIAGLGTIRFGTAPAVVFSHARWTAESGVPSSSAAFALFGRPPPVSASSA